MQTSWMLTECNEAADKIREQLKSDETLYREVGNRLRDLKPNFIATLARGSSDHVASYATYLIPQCMGRLVASLPPSVHTVLKASLRLRGQAVIAISQSGASPDLVQGIEACRNADALTIGILNNPMSDLASTAELVIDQKAGLEKSVAATKTVLGSMTSLARLVSEWARDPKLRTALNELPDVLAQAASVEVDIDVVQKCRGVFVLSRAFGECVARETALKFKETCGLHAEGFSTAEVRHGPREIIDEKFLTVGFALPESGADDVFETSFMLKEQGAACVIFGFEKAPTILSGQDITYIELPRPADDRLAPIVALQAVYPWLAKASAALGRNPDKPKNLKSKVVRTV